MNHFFPQQTRVCHVQRQIEASPARRVRCSAIPALALAICVAAGRQDRLKLSRTTQAVGGVSIRHRGRAEQLPSEESKMIVDAPQSAGTIPGRLNQPAKLRMISLRRMQEAIAAAQQAQQPLPR